MSEPLERITRKTFFDIAIDEKPVGRLVFGLFGDACPKTVKNFVALNVGSHFKKQTGGLLRDKQYIEHGGGGRTSYTGNHFHRVVPGSMAHAGDHDFESGRGGDTSIYGKYFDDENLDLKFSKPYLLAMDQSGPNKNGSKFIITFVEKPNLNGRSVIFGELLEGFDVIKMIEEAGGQDGKLTKPVKITWSGVIRKKK